AAVLAALEALDADFEIDLLDMKAKALATCAKTAGAAAARTLAESCLAAADEAGRAERVDVAEGLLGTAETAAGRSQTPALVTRAQAKDRELKEAKKDAEQARAAEASLKEKPDDPDASAAVGRYLCLRKGEWEKGLPHLAKGPDSPL